MAVDIEAVRFAYFNPPPEDVFYGVPTMEEQLAEAERRLVRLCIEDGGDPVAEALGEHGSLIGGPDKPLQLLIDHARPLEEYARPRLAPPAWFDHPQGKATSGAGSSRACTVQKRADTKGPCIGACARPPEAPL